MRRASVGVDKSCIELVSFVPRGERSKVEQGGEGRSGRISRREEEEEHGGAGRSGRSSEEGGG